MLVHRGVSWRARGVASWLIRVSAYRCPSEGGLVWKMVEYEHTVLWIFFASVISISTELMNKLFRLLLAFDIGSNLGPASPEAMEALGM